MDREFSITMFLWEVMFDEDIADISSDDDDSDEEELCSLLNPWKQKVPRVSIIRYYETTVQAYPIKTFVTHFRIQPELFWQLAKDYEETEEYQSMLLYNPNRVLKADKTLAIFLWFAAHEACAFRDVSDRFNISLSTVHWAIVRMTAFLSNKAAAVIKWPSAVEMVEEADVRETRCKIPGIVGEQSQVKGR